MKSSNLKNLLEPYQTGFASSTFDTPLTITTNIRELTKDFSLQFLSKSESKIFDQCNQIRQLCLQKAHKNNLEEAYIAHKQLLELSGDISKSAITKLLMDAQNYPLTSYLRYKEGHYTASIELLDEGAQIDYLLETQHGFYELQFHRLHLYFNQGKVLIKQHKFGKAFEQFIKLLDQMANPTLSFFENPLSIELNKSFDDLIKMLFQQIAQVFVQQHHHWVKRASASIQNNNPFNEYQMATYCIKKILEDADTYTQIDWLLFLSQGNQYLGELWGFLVLKFIGHFDLSKTDPSFHQTIMKDLKISTSKVK